MKLLAIALSLLLPTQAFAFSVDGAASATGLTGTVGVANGGTGQTSFTDNRILIGNGTSAIDSDADLIFDGDILTVGGSAARVNINGVASTADPFVVGTSTFVIKGDTGWVGIGTANPATGMHMSSKTFTLDGSGQTLTLGGGSYINFANATNGTGGLLWIGQVSSSLQVNAPSGGSHILSINNATVATVDVNGSRIATPSAQTIAAGNTVAADACGGIKLVTSGGAVTTDTTNTFTAPAAANNGCVMNVCNSGANNITLDNNANFKSAGGADVVLTADDCVQVGSTGSVWYQLSALLAN